ncbi:alpha/beta hydrolase [Tengunoibacter tsumagoiensis]|uniref:Alpha/beta hydrolase n=1 Tax=Tengunoibacter tsumagoiensis TaxID=2014871 RepID=A0A402A7H7_9CHLR|nr:alpha/beta hydrolase [Tengunoibacter tsumagoiensis]GCE15005.1 alpha/beta hydrolase [Tengunoibacter tsumagoiensis]
MTVLTIHEQQEIDRANQEGKQPIVFVHGLYLLASSWENWRVFFEEQGYVTLAPGWPDDPETVAEANDDPEVFANKRIKQVTEHYAQAIGQLKRKPVIVGHSFGGLIAQQLADEGLSAVTVAIDPAGFRGVLPVPLSELKSGAPVLSNPANYHRAVTLTYEQFRYGFTNALSEEEAHQLYDRYAVPGSGTPVFQAAAANLNPWTEDQVNTRNPERGPLLLIAGEKDHTVPLAVVKAAYQLQKHNPAVTQFREFAGRGHSLTIDHGWRAVAEIALAFIAEQLQISQ